MYKINLLPTLLAIVIIAIVIIALVYSFTHPAAPQIRLPERLYNFGKLKEGTIVHHNFTVHNSGRAKLLIHRVSASCVCSQTSLAAKSLRPGERTVLKVTLNTNGKPEGDYSGKISIFTNVPGHLVTELTIKAQIIKDPANSSQPGDVPAAINWQTISPREARRQLKANPSARLVDVRTPAEYQEGHIPGSILIPLDRLGIAAPVQLPDRNGLIIVYCRSGRRSKTAAQSLSVLGYNNVRDLGGILNWPYEVEQTLQR